jgi:hypothetical protein
MLKFVDMGHQFIRLFLDHDDSMRAVNWDDVIQFPVAELPPVISPCKPLQTVREEVQEPVPIQVVHGDEGDHMMASRRQGLRTRSKQSYACDMEAEKKQAAASRSNEEQAGSEKDDDPDYELDDSEYDISEDDEDLDADTIEEDKKMKHMSRKMKEEVGNDGYSEEEEDLWAPDSDEETVDFKFKTFREEDLKCVQFKVGQVFESVHLVRKAIRVYSCQNRYDIKLPVNDQKRIKAKCVGGETEECIWYLWASYDSRTKCWQIKRYCGDHTCSRKWKVHAFTANFLADKYLEAFRADQDMNMKSFSRIVQKDWNMTPSRSKLQRARRLAMTVIYGDEEGQYKLLWDYANEIRRSNPGSSFFVTLDENSRFRRAYMSMEASKRGFLEGCRPIIFIDGCFIKTRYRGQLLAAVGIDPNNCIFPIAVACVEVEDTANWTWFLETLKKDLDIVNTFPWTIMSDKQKVHKVYFLLA